MIHQRINVNLTFPHCDECDIHSFNHVPRASLENEDQAENKSFVPEGETHFPMTPEARLKNDNLTGLFRNKQKGLIKKT